MRALPFAFALLLTAPTEAASHPAFVACYKAQPAAACVYDGDTIWLSGVKIRIVGYDTPEMGAPLCAHKAAGANAARDLLIGILNSGEVEVAPLHKQSFDRELARITVDGRDLATLMLASPLARPEVEGDEPWC